MCEEKKSKICLPVRSGTQTGLIPARPHLFYPIVAGGKAGNVVNSGAMDKFSPAPYGGLPSEMWSIFPQGTTVSGNEKQTNFRLLNLCNRFCKAL